MENSLPDNLPSLSKAVANAQLLLIYAAERGITLDDSLTKALVKSKYLEQNNEWTDEEELNFWQAYNAFAKRMQPVSVKSILASQQLRVRRPAFLYKMLGWKLTTSLAGQAVRRYTALALLSIIILLIIQFFSIYETSLLQNIESLSTKKDALYQRYEEIVEISERDDLTQLLRLESEIAAIESEYFSNMELLVEWQHRLIFWKETESSLSNDDDIAQLRTQMNVPLREYITNKALQEAKYRISIISLYILPMFYGLLGAFAFVLRQLTDETKNLTYTKESDTRYTLRINLGALSGLATGLLLSSDGSQQIAFITSFSPLVIAFITGYSVEFLFTALDRLINSILKKKEEGKS